MGTQGSLRQVKLQVMLNIKKYALPIGKQVQAETCVNEQSDFILIQAQSCINEQSESQKPQLDSQINT